MGSASYCPHRNDLWVVVWYSLASKTTAFFTLYFDGCLWNQQAIKRYRESMSKIESDEVLCNHFLEIHCYVTYMLRGPSHVSVMEGALLLGGGTPGSWMTTVSLPSRVGAEKIKTFGVIFVINVFLDILKGRGATVPLCPWPWLYACVVYCSLSVLTK